MSYKPLEGLFGYVERHALPLDVEGWHQSRRIEGQMAEGEEGQCYREVHVWVEADLPATTPALQTVCETIARCQRRGGRGEFRTSLRLFGPDGGNRREIRSMGVAMGWNATGNALLRPVRDLLDGTVPANYPKRFPVSRPGHDDLGVVVCRGDQTQLEPDMASLLDKMSPDRVVWVFCEESSFTSQRLFKRPHEA